MTRTVTAIALAISMMMFAAQASAAYDIDDFEVEYLVKWVPNPAGVPGTGVWELVQVPDPWNPQELPEWGQGGLTLWIPNVERPRPWYKKLYVVIRYDQAVWLEEVPEINVIDPQIGVEKVGHDVSLGSATAYWEWMIVPQPPFELLLFSNTDVFLFENGVLEMAIGSICIPEPASLALISVGGLVLLVRRRGTE